MFLAVLLVAALVLNVSAADSENFEIGGNQYYCSLNCKASSATGTTQTPSTESKVGVYVKLFVDGVKVADGLAATGVDFSVRPMAWKLGNCVMGSLIDADWWLSFGRI